MLTIFWGVLALLLLVIDAITSALLLFGFGIAGLITMAFSRVMPFYTQVIIFFVTGTLISIYIVPKLRKIPKTKNYEESLIGIVFNASEDIKTGKTNQQKVKGTYWNVITNEDVSKGETLEIIKINKENNTLEVLKKIN